MLANRVATALTVTSTVLAVASAGLLVSRYVPYRLVPVPTDTWAMATAFTDFAAPGSLLALGAAAGSLALGSPAARRRRTRLVLAAVCTALVAVQVPLLAPRWSAGTPPAAQRSVTVLALNSRLGQADPAALVAAARTADIVVLTETTAPQVRALDDAGFADRFPHRSTGPLPRRGAGGTAVFSRFGVTATEQLTPELANQSWVCAIDLPGPAPGLTVVAVHPGRPRPGGSSWLSEQEDLRAALPTSGPRLLAGDFNAVASHPTQRALVENGWASAVDQAGAGWVPTYPAGSSRVPPLIDIDHVYVTDALRATSARSVAVPGSDHLGLLVTVAVTDGR